MNSLFFHGRCAGQNSCSYRVEELRHEFQPCSREFTFYLEASFLCLPGQSPNSAYNISKYPRTNCSMSQFVSSPQKSRGCQVLRGQV